MSAMLEAPEASAQYLEAVLPSLVRQFDLLAVAPGGVARLRELILSLAVRGKLVPQDRNDDPVRLDDAAAQVLRLVDEGKVPRSRASELIEDRSDESEVPIGWAAVRASDVFIPRSGNSKLIKGKLFSVAGEGLYAGFSASGQDVWLSSFEYDGTAVILSAVGARCGKAFLARGKWSAIANTHIVWPLEGIVTAEYAMLLLNDENFWIRSGGAQPFLKVTETLQGTVLIPSLREQARIIARVDELMRLCDALEAKGRLEAEQHARLLGTLLSTLTDSSTPEELAANWQRVADHFDLLLDRPEAVDALEQTILQLAVRGLLVPQDSGEEPANLLLFEIHADRRRLLGSKIAKADKPSPPINEAEVRFALPSGWSWARLSEISNVIVDCPHSTAKFVDTGLLCLDTNSFKDGKLVAHKLRFVSQETFDQRIARLKPVPGDLVFAREGSVGQSIIIPEGIECCLGQRVMLFRLSQRVSNEFVRLAITTEDFLDALLSLHKGIGAKHVNVADMRNAVVPVPPFREQERILARITELSRLCADLRERLAASQTTQSHLAEALVDSAAA